MDSLFESDVEHHLVTNDHTQTRQSTTVDFDRKQEVKTGM